MDVQIRSVTVFIPFDTSTTTPFATCVDRALTQACTIRRALESAGITVQTTRVATKGPSSFGTTSAAQEAASILQNAVGDQHYACMGTIRPTDDPSFINANFITQLLLENQSLFLTTTVTRQPSTIDMHCIRTAASVIKTLSKRPFDNARFSALANVRAGCPFFPAAYAPDITDANETPAYFPTSIAVQGASLAAQCVSETTSAGTCAALLTQTIEAFSKRLVAICRPFDITVDFSLAPFPTPQCSTADSIARLAGGPFGHAGTLLAAGVLASAIDAADFPRAGFCGIMLPVLEDVRLATSERLSIDELLMVSAVCGTGLDTVPLAGDIDQECLERIIVDVATLSIRLGGKQLTARLMPIGGKTVGEKTEFDFEFFCNGRVLDGGRKSNGGCRAVRDDELVLRALR